MKCPKCGADDVTLEQGVSNSCYCEHCTKRFAFNAQIDAWKKTPEAVAAWSSCYDMEVLADLMYYANSGGYHIDPSMEFGSFADKKVEAMHERGLL